LSIFVYEDVLGLEVAVNDTTGMAEVERDYDLMKELLNLVGGEVVFVLIEEGLEIIIYVFEHKVKFFVFGFINNVFETNLKRYSTMLGCLSSLRIEISRMAVDGMPSSSFSRRICF
jgi:hypothetical protein